MSLSGREVAKINEFTSLYEDVDASYYMVDWDEESVYDIYAPYTDGWLQDSLRKQGRDDLLNQIDNYMANRYS
jgi:hypothetical protein